MFVEYLENNNEITYTKEYIDIYYYANNSTDNKFIRISDIEGFKKEFNKYKNRVDYKELEERFNETNKEVKYEY